MASTTKPANHRKSRKPGPAALRRRVPGALALYAIVLLILFACEDLKVSNPADPNYNLAPPDLLSVIPRTDTDIEIRWQNNEEYTQEFVVSRRVGSQGAYQALATVAASRTTYLDTTCTLNTTYSYAIQSKVESNLSRYSNFTVASTTFQPPSDLNATSISDSEIRLTWTDNTTYEMGFKIERDAGSGFTEIGTVGADVTEYTDSVLTFGQSYTYRVAAYTALNQSDFSAITTILVDVDGHIYTIIQIGDQIWLAENLQVTHYRNGDPIPTVTDNSEWSNLTTGASCEYGNNSGNVATYGRLYNWYAVNDSRNIAPAGWHVPMDHEWKALEMALGMSQSDAGDSGWGGTNEGSQLAGNGALWEDDALKSNSVFGSSGFTALPGGCRSASTGAFIVMGNGAYFWSATEDDSNTAWSRRLYYGTSGVYRNFGYKSYGFAVRLVRD